ncbi:hypothetical protein DV738_g3296, partial [Chaetothyriales sp. CBS 135597]
MAGSAVSPAEMITQLEAARKLALADAQVYVQVVPGILPIIGPNASVEVRRWGADFLAEAFASPTLGHAQKEQLTAEVVPVLRSFIDNAAEDVAVIRSVVQAATSIYPLVFRRIIAHPDEAALWHDMAAIKLSIMQRMDSAFFAVRICCVKFIQKVVHVETPGQVPDPRRPELNETSIALVPRSHPLLNLSQLEAEASGLLDRLLSVFQDSTADPIIIDSTLNCLAVLIRSRPAIADKILSAVLSFNPLGTATQAMSPRLVVIFKSMERTTRALLRYILRSMPNHPMEQRIQAYLGHLQASKATFFSDNPSLKRPAEPVDPLADAKRQRLAAAPPRFPPMPPPPNTLTQLFTLTPDQVLTQFDVKLLPIHLVNSLVVLLLEHINEQSLTDAVGGIKARLAQLSKASIPTPVPEVPMAGPTGIDDDDDYDPEFGLGISSSAAAPETALEELSAPTIDLGPFELPKPPPLNEAQVYDLQMQTVDHMEALVKGSEHFQQPPARQKLGLNRLAASANDRDAWFTIMVRLATRASSSLQAYDDQLGDGTEVKQDPESRPEADFANRIRQRLYEYILDDFRAHLNLAISWLTEEWYCDRIRLKANPALNKLPNYSTWSYRVLSGLLVYLDARDKNILIRFLSEIPAVTKDILDLVKTLADDPERVNMCILGFKYLLMLRPPVRELVLDTVQELWMKPDAQTKSVTTKLLKDWRPHLLEQADDGRVANKSLEKINGLASVTPPVEITS